MKIDFKKLGLNYHTKVEEELSKWLQINSIYDEKTVLKDRPFGEGVHNALQFIGKLAEKDGFKVDYCEGYVTEISFGEGPIIGIYAHADVVPVSGEWKYPPFSGTIAEGKIYSRGASDDKGAAMASYYALKLLKDHHLIDGYQVRLAIGGNEERGSSCLHHYFHALHKPAEKYGFTPDGAFPLIYGEKGIVNYEIYGKVDLFPIMALKAGVVANSVIDKAEATVAGDFDFEPELKKFGYKYQIKKESGLTLLTIFGKSAHGSLPQLGVNAGIQLLNVLGATLNTEILSRLAHQYANPNGINLGLYYNEPMLKETTYNVGLINYQQQNLSLTVNFRYPENVNHHEIITKVKKLSHPLEVRADRESRMLLFSPDTPFIQTLHHVYVEETGDTVNQPMTIGGGTYAKETQNSIAFGPNFPGKNDYIHESDEKIDLEDLHALVSIYARAIYELGHLDAGKK